jgi:hypothetical protein
MTPETTVLETNSCSRSEYNYMHSSLDNSASFYPAQKFNMSSSSTSTSSSSSSTVSDGDDDDVINKQSHILKIVDSFSKLFEDYLDIHADIHIDRDIDLVEERDNCTYDNNNNNNNNNKSARMSNNCTPTDVYNNYSDKDYLSSDYMNSKQSSFALGSFVKRNKNHHNHMKKTRVSVNMQLLDIQ